MKKALVVLLVLLTALSLVACGGGNTRALVGTWELVDAESEATYGFGLEFKSDGTMSYGLTSDMLAQYGGDDISADEITDALSGLSGLMDIKYKILSDTEMEITVSALFGMASESTKIPYELNGDTLTFDGAVYARASK